MYKESHTKLKRFDRKQSVIITGAVVAVILVILAVVHLTQPKRSIDAYCQVYKQEKSRLSAMSNNSNPYPSGVFNVSVNDAGEIATSFGRLGRVAPSTIEPNVKALQNLYQDIHNNPSHAISDSLNGGSADDSLAQWTRQKCEG